VHDIRAAKRCYDRDRELPDSFARRKRVDEVGTATVREEKRSCPCSSVRHDRKRRAADVLDRLGGIGHGNSKCEPARMELRSDLVDVEGAVASEVAVADEENVLDRWTTAWSSPLESVRRVG